MPCLLPYYFQYCKRRRTMSKSDRTIKMSTVDFAPLICCVHKYSNTWLEYLRQNFYALRFVWASIEMSIEKKRNKKEKCLKFREYFPRLIKYPQQCVYINICRMFLLVFFIYYKRCITKINCTQYFFSTYRHVFSINAPYVNEKPISRSQTRAVHV